MKIRITTGTEGPRHDPYGFEEITVERDEMKVTAHFGLADYLELNGTRMLLSSTDIEYIENMFTQLTGINFKQARRYFDRIENPRRCRHCGTKRFEWFSGFPGESLMMCVNCGRIVATNFNMAEVI